VTQTYGLVPFTSSYDLINVYDLGRQEGQRLRRILEPRGVSLQVASYRTQLANEQDPENRRYMLGMIHGMEDAC